MFKEYLKYNIVPFMMEDDLKMSYYRCLKEWFHEKGYLVDTCLTAQDRYKGHLDETYNAEEKQNGESKHI